MDTGVALLIVFQFLMVGIGVYMIFAGLTSAVIAPATSGASAIATLPLIAIGGTLLYAGFKIKGSD
jgi:hypothetical protein